MYCECFVLLPLLIFDSCHVSVFCQTIILLIILLFQFSAPISATKTTMLLRYKACTNMTKKISCLYIYKQYFNTTYDSLSNLFLQMDIEVLTCLLITNRINEVNMPLLLTAQRISNV